MKWHDFETTYQAARRCRIAQAERLGREAWHRDFAPTNVPELAHAYRDEFAWGNERRPYYSVWPLVAEGLTSLKLDLDAELIRLPLPTLLVRMAVGHELACAGGRKLHAMLAARTTVRGGKPGLAIHCDWGERKDMPVLGPNAKAWPIYSYWFFELRPGRSIEQCLTDLDYVEMDKLGVDVDLHRIPMLTCVRLLCALSLLSRIDEDSILKPDVLADDEEKYAAATSEEEKERLVERARNRGKIGWHVGRGMESHPHYRRPHFALRWTEKGRVVPKIVPVKGAFVKRQAITQVPTGYLDAPLCLQCGKQPANTEHGGLCNDCRGKRGLADESAWKAPPVVPLEPGEIGYATEWPATAERDRPTGEEDDVRPIDHGKTLGDKLRDAELMHGDDV